MIMDICRVSSTFRKMKYVQVLNVYRHSVQILHVYRMRADIRRIGRGFFWHRAGLRYDANYPSLQLEGFIQVGCMWAWGLSSTCHLGHIIWCV